MTFGRRSKTPMIADEPVEGTALALALEGVLHHIRVGLRGGATLLHCRAVVALSVGLQVVEEGGEEEEKAPR